MVVSTKDIMTSEEKGYDNFLPIFEFFHMIEGLAHPACSPGIEPTLKI